MKKRLKSLENIVLHVNNLLAVVCICVLYGILYLTNVDNNSFVKNIYVWLEGSSIDLFITQVTSSFLVISITAMLTTKGKTIYWEDTIHYMLINPPRMNLRSISDYCFFDVGVSFIASVCGKNGAVLISFAFNMFFLICMTYKLLKIYFGKEEIQKELLDFFYGKVLEYKKIIDDSFVGYEHYESIIRNEAKCELYNGKEDKLENLYIINNVINSYVDATKESTLDAIFDNRFNEVAENMSFLVDYRGYNMISDFFKRNDIGKEDYLNAFFRLRIRKIYALEKYYNDGKQNIMIVKTDEWFIEAIKEMQNNPINGFEIREDNWCFENRLFSDFYSYDENDLNSDLDIVLSLFENNKRLSRTLFEFIILEDIFIGKYINKDNIGFNTALIILDKIKKQL